jgi:hypothetical protein
MLLSSQVWSSFVLEDMCIQGSVKRSKSKMVEFRHTNACYWFICLSLRIDLAYFYFLSFTCCTACSRLPMGSFTDKSSCVADH